MASEMASLPAPSNLLSKTSVELNPGVVDDYNMGELQAGRYTLVCNPDSMHISPLGLVPKSGTPGRFQLPLFPSRAECK